MERLVVMIGAGNRSVAASPYPTTSMPRNTPNTVTTGRRS
jgi:hypothetical protein